MSPKNTYIFWSNVLRELHS